MTRRREETYGLRGRSVMAKPADVEINVQNGKSYFFFNDTATTEIYTLSLHDALPIRPAARPSSASGQRWTGCCKESDRKSTRLNSSHVRISYAVFCLKIETLVVK